MYEPGFNVYLSMISPRARDPSTCMFLNLILTSNQTLAGPSPESWGGAGVAKVEAQDQTPSQSHVFQTPDTRLPDTHTRARYHQGSTSKATSKSPNTESRFQRSRPGRDPRTIRQRANQRAAVPEQDPEWIEHKEQSGHKLWI
jgi:hypothetical protein